MTTYGEAFQMGIAANFAVGTLNEISCAGEALSRKALELAENPNIDGKVLDTLSHVLNHLSVVRELCEAYDEVLTEKIEAFSEANPGKLTAISKEISEDELIVRMQGIIGMSQKERVDKIEANMKQLLEIDLQAGLS